MVDLQAWLINTLALLLDGPVTVEHEIQHGDRAELHSFRLIVAERDVGKAVGKFGETIGHIIAIANKIAVRNRFRLRITVVGDQTHGRAADRASGCEAERVVVEPQRSLRQPDPGV